MLMVTLLEVARDSEKTYRESIISTSNKTKSRISDYVIRYKKDKNSMFGIIKAEKIETLQKFFDIKYQENKTLLPIDKDKANINKNVSEFYAVLSNNKLNSPNFSYFSVDEMYDLHAQSGAYIKSEIQNA